ncbi:MAG: folate-binding protein [Rhodospirillales bacterium]|nr:folate-binding protein [Rhodospirillales bacterium]
MSDLRALVLDARGVLRVAGEDRLGFLQGIVSNDVAKAAPDRALWSAFLTPQGKFLHEFFLAESEDGFLLDCEAARLADLQRRLSIYKLRSKVSLEDISADFAVAALFGAGALEALGLAEAPGSALPFAGGLAYTDPRLSALGARALLPRADAGVALEAAGFAPGTLADYDRLRISLGVPDGSRDLEVEKSILLENGFDELHGVDWDKGCFMGQELTARTKYRALIKKRLLPVEINGPTPAPGTPVTAGGKEAGVMRSATDGLGLALLRLEALEGTGSTPLTAGDATLTPKKPDWAAF